MFIETLTPNKALKEICDFTSYNSNLDKNPEVLNLNKKIYFKNKDVYDNDTIFKIPHDFKFYIYDSLQYKIVPEKSFQGDSSDCFKNFENKFIVSNKNTKVYKTRINISNVNEVTQRFVVGKDGKWLYTTARYQDVMFIWNDMRNKQIIIYGLDEECIKNAYNILNDRIQSKVTYVETIINNEIADNPLPNLTSYNQFPGLPKNYKSNNNIQQTNNLDYSSVM